MAKKYAVKNNSTIMAKNDYSGKLAHALKCVQRMGSAV